MHCSWRRWSLNINRLSWAALPSRALSHDSLCTTLKWTKSALLKVQGSDLAVWSPPCPKQWPLRGHHSPGFPWAAQSPPVSSWWEQSPALHVSSLAPLSLGEGNLYWCFPATSGIGYVLLCCPSKRCQGGWSLPWGPEIVSLMSFLSVCRGPNKKLNDPPNLLQTSLSSTCTSYWGSGMANIALSVNKMHIDKRHKINISQDYKITNSVQSSVPFAFLSVINLTSANILCSTSHGYKSAKPSKLRSNLQNTEIAL